MASTYTNDLRLELIAVGEGAGSAPNDWGSKTNVNLKNIAAAFGPGTENLSSDADVTLTLADGTADEMKALYLKVTSGVNLTAPRVVTIAPNTVAKLWFIENATSGGQSLVFSQGSGGNVTVTNSSVKVVYSDGAGSGAAITDALVDLDLSGITTVDSISTTSILTTANAALALAPNGTGTVVVKGNTNSGAITLNCESNSHGQKIYGQPHSAQVTNTLMLPAGANSTLVSLVSADTLTNKTLTSPKINDATAITATGAELNYLDIATLGLTAASKAVTADANGVVTLDNGFSEEYAAVTSSSNVVSLNLRTAGNFSHDLTENTTISFTNPAASGKASFATLKIIQGSTARTITWNSSIKWAADTAPTLSTGNDNVDIFTFYTIDGGTNYYGVVAGQVMS